MKVLKKLLLFAIVSYILLCGVLYLFQERIIFNPEKLPENYVFQAGEEVEIEVEKGVSLNCLWLKEPESKGVILYLHGNKGANKRCLHQAETMTGNGYDIFMPDYRGYGKSDGEITSEEQMHGDMQQVYDFLKKHYEEKNMVVAGYSLGTGMATRLAADNRPAQVVLLAPYTSIADIKNRRAPFLPDFLLKYPLYSDQFLKKIKAPVSIFHGTSDEVIPFDCAERLCAEMPATTHLYRIEGAGHRRVIFSDLFRTELGKLLKQ